MPSKSSISDWNSNFLVILSDLDLNAFRGDRLFDEIGSYSLVPGSGSLEEAKSLAGKTTNDKSRMGKR